MISILITAPDHLDRRQVHKKKSLAIFQQND